ncbi:cytochrome P450 1A1-like isoform X2 [Rhinatrema bivittatum]|uniref:cytochrome P450 1A1-like isoform X2 n=1 Tax=Rhinatrema bivittatum TaxID=194408 RepID=UPI00112D6C79|nr:cytochrome P450 1A1-like isoform X2 [Rhinatrema bivittatum]
MVPGADVDMIIFITGLVIVLVIMRIKESLGKQGKSLPGPWALPVIGNIFQIGKSPHLSLTKMRETYGEVFLIKLGVVPVVVVSGLETMKQVLVKQGDDYAGRPKLYSFSLLADGNSLSFSVEFGEKWKLHKKIAKNALRTFSKSEAKSSTCSCILEEQVSAEASELVRILSECSAEKGSIDPSSIITCAVGNVICALCFGKRYEHSNKEFLSVVEINEELRKVSGACSSVDFLPLLRFLPFPAVKALRMFYSHLNNFITKSVQKHYATYDKNNVRDITDALIYLCDERKLEDKSQALTDAEIIATVHDIFGADEKIGDSRLPRFDDRKELHYTEAFINEVFRHSSFVPFALPHCTTRDTSLYEYFIPKNTCVFVNIYQVNHDQTLWKNPDMFTPERFLDANKQLDKSMVEKVVLFGLGVRKCLGEDVARNELFLLLTAILQQLRVERHPGDKLDLTPVYGIVMKPQAYRLKAESRT